MNTYRQDDTNGVAEMFRMLGEPNRLNILFTLAEADELCVHEIAARIDANDNTVSQALRLLRTAGIVASRRDGRHKYYRLDDDHVATLLATAREHTSHQAAER